MASTPVETKQGDLALLNDPVAQKLLRSANVAHLAYIWHDGTPRVVPMWFQWTGEEVVMGSPPNAPKVLALPENPKVSIEIDSAEWPYKALVIRGTAKLDLVDGIDADYAAAAERFFGEEQGRAWVAQLGTMFNKWARISIKPEWVCILDFEIRFPSAFS